MLKNQCVSLSSSDSIGLSIETGMMKVALFAFTLLILQQCVLASRHHNAMVSSDPELHMNAVTTYVNLRLQELIFQEVLFSVSTDPVLGLSSGTIRSSD